LAVQRSNLPVAPYFASSANPGTNYEQIVLRTNTTGPANMNAISWYLGVLNKDVAPVTYTIRAVLPTNGILVSGLPINVKATVPGGTNVQLQWGSTVNGEKYEIQTNGNLSSIGWGALTDLVASGTSMSFISPIPVSAAPGLFYRVVQVP
jgi:hypothetical protein